MRLKIVVLCFLLLFGYSFAGKKVLIFEDAETLGKGGLQNENYIIRQEPRTTEYTFNLTYGLLEKVDLGLNVPLVYVEKLETNNLSLDLKWRFFEKEETKLALKFSSELPTKDSSISYGPTLTLQTSFGNLSLYSNSSYEFRSESFLQSLSVELNMAKGVNLIATGFYTSEDSQTGIIGGVSLSGNRWELGLGVQKILKSDEKPSILAGLTVRFR
ncbi:hypothetical protein [Thermocrinis sp.]